MSSQALTVSGFHEVFKGRQVALQNFLGSEKNALRFTSSVMQCVQANPKLLECNQQSLIGAFLECAAVSLFPSNWSGECYVLPYQSPKGMVAQFQMGYKGFITLGYRNGVQSIWSEIVYKNDKFREVKGTDPKIEHEPAGADRGDPVGVYACAKVNNEKIFVYMLKEQIMNIKDLSKAKDSKYSPWNSRTDPELWMWKKTAIKQLAKMFPRNDNNDYISRAIQMDNIAERGGYFNKEGKMVEQEWDQEKPEVPTIEQVKSRIEEVETMEEMAEYQQHLSSFAHGYTPEEKKEIMQLVVEKKGKLGGKTLDSKPENNE